MPLALRPIAALLVLAAPASALGQERAPLELTWDAPSVCPTGASVEASVERLVGAERLSSARGTLRVQGHVVEEAGQFLVTLEIHQDGTRSERRVTAPTCALAADASAVILGMLLPDAPAPPATRNPPSAGAREGVAPTLAAAPADDLAPHALPPRTFWLGAAGFVDSATLPSATPGAQVTGTWHPGSFGMYGAFGAAPSSHAAGRTTVDGRTLGADVGLVFASMRGDYVIGDRVALVGRAGFDLGVLHATGTGAWSPKANDAFWIAAAAGPSVRWRVGDRFALLVGVEAVLPLLRPTLVIDADAIHRPAVVAARALVGAEIGF